MAVKIDITGRRKRVMILASNAAVSAQTGWPIGFWWEELTAPYLAFTRVGFDVDIVSPDGGALQGDGYSDPRDPSGYSADDIVSMGFIHTPSLMAKVEASLALGEVDTGAYDAILLVGGQGPMYTFAEDERVHRLVGEFFASGRITGVVCHATCVLLGAQVREGALVVDGLTWTGFANAEEEVADAAAGLKIQPFRIEDRARAIPGTNFIVGPAFSEHAVRDGNLITGQQQHSSGAAAQLIIEALGR
jgi:putative intracellular protease/amidase